jgi:hypothetical protein
MKLGMLGPQVVEALKQLADRPQAFVGNLLKLPRTATLQDVNQLVPELNLSKILREACAVGWGDDDGRDMHFMQRLQESTDSSVRRTRQSPLTVGLLDLLQAVGMWVYSR